MFLYDFHSHILPCVDHGSGGIETTKKQFEIISKSGVAAVVATPHFYPHMDSLGVFLQNRQSALDSSLSFIKESGLKLCLGAEVLLCEGMERMEGLLDLCIQGTNTLLVEMPFTGWKEPLLETLCNISNSGINVILAHIDRYPEKNMEKLSELCELKLQLNAEALCSFFGRRRYIPMLKKGMISAIGSDLHGVKGYNYFRSAVKHMGSDITEKVMSSTEKLLENAKIYG